MKRFLLFILAVWIGNITAAPVPYYTPHAFLKHGFGLYRYKLCKRAIHLCSRTIGSNCGSELIKKDPLCGQFAKLLQALQMPYMPITATRYGNLILLDVLFQADGQHWYLLITKDGRIIDTKIDPRRVSKKLALRYGKQTLLMVEDGKPSYKVLCKGTQIFTVKLRATKGCLACPTVGVATIDFAFNKNGELQSVALINFKTYN